MFLLVHTQPLIMSVLLSLSAIILVISGITVNWKRLYGVPVRLHLFIALFLALGFFWCFISIPVNKVLLVHPIFVTSIALIFGFRLSLLFGALALLVSHVAESLYWENYGFHFLTGVCVPVLVTFLVHKLIQRIKLKILFFYTLGVGFIGGMLSIVGAGLSSLALLWVFDSTLYWPALDHIYLYLLLAFPEGFCNGVIVSSLTVLKPDLLKTFDEDFYLR